MRHVHAIAALAFSSFCGLASTAWADTADFAVLAGAAVTCTDSTVQGSVGLADPGLITNTGCVMNGQAGTQAAQDAYNTFLTDYSGLASQPPCNFHEVPLAGAYLSPGVYCYDAAVTVTNGTLTLVGNATDTWVFRIGALGTGALTGTGFNVVVTGGATCDNSVLWWTAQGATLTDSVFVGSILAGADITITGGSLAGQVAAGGKGQPLARTGAVTLTGTTVDFCTTNPPPPPPVPPLPVFVIGDLQPHAVGMGVNFWGAQWWKNNPMSGPTSPGASRASFKGYATSGEIRCGHFWESLPGNSSSPPATIAQDIAVVVTSTVIKNGPNLGGDIKEFLIVHQDGGYGPNPGHDGNGVVTKVVCKQ